MAIQTMHDTGDGYQITPKLDGGLYASHLADCVCKGIGDEFTLNWTANSLGVSFSAGSEAVIGGAFFKVTSTETLTLAPSTTIYLCANIDLTANNGLRGSFVQRTSSNMQSGNLNGNGTTRDLLLYKITTTATGISSVEDKRIIKGDGTSINGYDIVIISQSNYNSLAQKDQNTLYFIYS